MKTRLRSWWQTISKPLDTVIIGFIIILMTLTIVSILGYFFHWNWTGLPSYTSSPHSSTSTFLPEKTLWDWLQLLIIPAVLALGGYLFNYTASRNDQEATKQRDQTERDIASDNQREAALQTYIDKISELLLKEHLRESKPEEEVRTIAHVRTMTTLPRLDETRKGSVVQFLWESKLISEDSKIISLEGANLSGANLSKANLSGANLSGANLIQANLTQTNLSGANLSGANLSGANLYGVNLSKADLRRTNLTQANLTQANLTQANLTEAILAIADLSVIDLTEANLSGTNLMKANLNEADLTRANLFAATLNGANLAAAYLSGADLTRANLFQANLFGVDLTQTNLTEVNLTQADLTKATLAEHEFDQILSLKDATMPDGSKHQ